jgi:endonuclease/exonuclease/phosphatase family metal-dependent hydrolase
MLWIFLASFSASANIPVNNLSGDTLRLVTYNVYHFGRNPSYPDGNYQVIADILKDLNPDVVCLQELDSVNSRSKGVYQAKQMADLNLWNYCFAGVLPFQGGRYGIGIATPRNILESSWYLLTSVREQRGFLIAEFDKYVMVCTHFGGDNDTRFIQAQELTAKVKELYGYSTKPVFLGGDLNSTPQSAVMKELYKSWILISEQGKTNGVECIDYLLLNQGTRYKVLDSHLIGTSPYGDMAVDSDHFPVIVTVIIPY